MIMSIGILVALVFPCIAVWCATYYFCLRTKPLKFDKFGNPILPKITARVQRSRNRRFTGNKKDSFKGKLKDFLYVSTGLDGKMQPRRV